MTQKTTEIKDPNLEPKRWHKRACKMLNLTVVVTILKENEEIWAQTADPLYAWPQESLSFVDFAQNNHDSKNIRQYQVHIIDQQIKDLKRLLEYEKY